jgi:hypothetical protein
MADTPEGKVKKDVRKFLHEEGCVKAGMKKKDYPPEQHGWYYMPSANGLGVSGIPDFVGCYGGWFFSIETKAPGKLNEATPNQEKRMEEIRCADGVVFLVDNVEVLQEQWDEIFGLLRGEQDAREEA